MEHREEMLKNWHQAATESLYWNKMANDRLSEINKQLIALATILIPLTASVLVINQSINNVLRTLLIGSWVFLFASVATGFVQIIVDGKFYKKYCNYEASRSQIYHESMRLRRDDIDAIEERINGLGSLLVSSGHLFLVLQGIPIIIGLLLIMGVAGTLLIAK